MSMLEHLFNHLVLPPKLPGGREKDYDDIPRAIINLLTAAIDKINILTDNQYQDMFCAIRLSLQISGHLNHNSLDLNSLITAFDDIKTRPLFLHVVEQNVGLIIRPSISNEDKVVVFEAFEASPSSEQVLAAGNALIQDFPGRAAQIPLATFLKHDFKSSFAEFLESSSSEALNFLTANVRKAGVSITEIRDTSNPSLITQMLMSLLETFGDRAHISLLRKKVRDDVNIDDSLLPWRRHPMWLILRVALQRELCLKLGDLPGRICYKLLIAVLLAQFLEQCCIKTFRLELTVLLRAKLCVRMSKLDGYKSELAEGSPCRQLFDKISLWLQEAIDAISAKIDKAWAKIRIFNDRKIQDMPSSADRDHLQLDTRLNLACSGEYLNSLLSLPRVHSEHKKPNTYCVEAEDDVMKRTQKFSEKYFELAHTEEDMRNLADRFDQEPNTWQAWAEQPVKVAEELCCYLDEVGDAYNSDPVQMSALLLNVFRLWTVLDSLALDEFPQLRQHHPVFSPDLLDILQVPDVRDMPRLQAIQDYLRRRIADAQWPNIFTQLQDRHSFASQYVPQSIHMQELLHDIQDDSDDASQDKVNQWHRVRQKFDQLTQEISNHSCRCVRAKDGTMNIKYCTRCVKKLQRKHLGINIHEDYLPTDSDSLSAAIVLELSIPPLYEAYRHATWRIIRDLAHPRVNEGLTDLPLKDFKQLRAYSRDRWIEGGLSLASTCKSFSQSHYRVMVASASLNQVIRPFGPRFELYDYDHKIWVRDVNLEALTLQHICGVSTPSILSNVIPLNEHPPAVFQGLSSYQLIANQRQCPQQASLHEFSAHQRLLCGFSHRWMSILVELGSSNLNFSNGETTRFIEDLATQAGPSSQGNNLRDAYMVFEDPSFCHRLTRLIRNRLDTIKSNWREGNCMEMLITLIERLHSMQSCSGSTVEAMSTQAHELIVLARNITLAWITHLRDEIRKATDGDTATRLAAYAFKAAVLCRKTFSLTRDVMSAEEVSTYCQASIALQENCPLDVTTNPSLKRILIRDIKMVWGLRYVITTSIVSHPQSVEEAILRSWSLASGDRSSFSSWDYEGDDWVVARMTTQTNQFTYSQNVRLDFLRGFLLVNGKSIEKLPLNIQNSPAVRTLFGGQHLRTYPSQLGGMSHRLATTVEGHEIHFGNRNGQVIIQALNSYELLEFVPPSVFSSGSSFDIPLTLRDGACVHFLNFRTRKLEIRRRPKIWHLKQRDWVIDIGRRECTKGKHPKISRLVEPSSLLGRKFRSTFEDFVEPEGLTVFQPSKGNLTVEISRFDLSFTVNKHSKLEENKLRMEIDPNQDAKTFYGLKSKLVLRDVNDLNKRSVLVPVGVARYRLSDHHVEIVIDTTTADSYTKFEIDEIVGRLTCAPEPMLVFSKAYFHALTSFPLPDPLTFRTGTEEAMHTLQAGMAQPWSPLKQHNRLPTWIAELSPVREYYPKDKRRLQKVVFSRNLPILTQHDGFEMLARKLIDKSHRLQPFFSSTDKFEQAKAPSHLRLRGLARRAVHSMAALHESCEVAADKLYASRDNCSNSNESDRVITIARTVLRQPFQLQRKLDLRALLEAHEVIGGFGGPPAASLNKSIEDGIIPAWGSLVEFSKNLDTDQPFALAFRLGLLAFGRVKKSDMALLEVLIAFSKLDSLKAISTPDHSGFTNIDSLIPNKETLQGLIRPLWPPFHLPRRARNVRAAQERHLQLCEQEEERLVDFFMDQWPELRPSLDDFGAKTQLIDQSDALEAIMSVWELCLRNTELSQYIQSVQGVLDEHIVDSTLATPTTSSKEPTSPRVYIETFERKISVIPCLGTELLSKCGPTDLQLLSHLSPQNLVRKSHTQNSFPSTLAGIYGELAGILQPFTSSDDALRRNYGEGMWRSLQALQQGSVEHGTDDFTLEGCGSPILVLNHRISAVTSLMEEQRKQILEAIFRQDCRWKWLRRANLWPGVNTVTLLEQLRSSSNVQFGPGMKEAIVSYGVTITWKQWLNRARYAVLKNDQVKLSQLLRNTGYENWNPIEEPNWLLMQIEIDAFIRKQQIDVARAIISPTSQANSLLQLQMGEGKTSCIVPMALSLLADGDALARIVVPKALLFSTAHILQSRIGGLVGREVRHIPFSRRTPSTREMLELYQDLHEEIRVSSGVILTTPDHLLSFKLSGLQRLADKKMEEARIMIRFQDELTEGCRDIIDESDLSLGVKTQLIYPSGPQLHIDGSPGRWEVAQVLLDLASQHLSHIRLKFPRGLEVLHLQTGQGFPLIYFLQKEAEHELRRLLIEDICNDRTPFLRSCESGKFHSARRQHIFQFLNDPTIKGVKVNKRFFADRDSAQKTMFLLRGLLFHGILQLCLGKRWNIEYGLHPERVPIAVPFEAKGVPSEQAEFGHPDVSIILTTLSFYYAGLTLAQFRQGLAHVLSSDDPAMGYDRWTSGCKGLPEGLRHYHMINADDESQMEELYSHLRLNRDVLKHFLNNFVFPIHAKAFELKIAASAWDIPLLPKPSNIAGSASKTRTSGFSGTNDNRDLLPLSIKQDDLRGLLSTNAEVLSYLLQTRNRSYSVAVVNGKRMTEEQLLERLAKINIRVLIDAGAYILEMSNSKLAQKWLEYDNRAKAAVYYEAGRAWVLYRGVRGKRLPLSATPFHEDLSEAVVFFDQAHCRGVDLKLPHNARACLTLGPGQNKDHTVQAAMRLRLLATSQAVTFFAPPEVDASIRQYLRIPHGSNKLLSSPHVIQWLLEQSCISNERLQNLHLAQGFDFCRKLNTQWSNDKFLTVGAQGEAVMDVVRQKERQDLQQQYGDCGNITHTISASEVSSGPIKIFMETLEQLRDTVGESSNGGPDSSALEEVEQEREVEFQVEEVRQVEKSKRCRALKFPGLHEALEDFVLTGSLDGGSGYVNAFSSLENTEIGQKFGLKASSSNLFCSEEFVRTVVLGVGKQAKNADNFLRPVEWILWSPSTETCVLIIPEEAELLIPRIRQAGRDSRVHLITYTAPVTKTMQVFNDLDFYTIPSLPRGYAFPAWFLIELGIFSGRLYFRYSEYSTIKTYLEKLEDVDGGGNADGVLFHCSFVDKPMAFMQEWLALRRQVQDCMHTPMGYICQGLALTESHPFFMAPKTEATVLLEARTATGSSDMSIDNYDDDDDDDDDWSDIGDHWDQGSKGTDEEMTDDDEKTDNV